MRFNRLQNILLPELKKKIETHKGLTVFAKNRAQFEGWLKVELVDILQKHFPDVEPEKGFVDISFDNWLIELKTINTNYKYPEARELIKPITDNIDGIIDDIILLPIKKEV